MAVSIRHRKVAAGTQNPARQVSVNEWNDTHAITGNPGAVAVFGVDGNLSEGTVPNVNVSGFATIMSRANLAAVASPANGDARVLFELGREGIFVFDSRNLTTFVTADTAQAIYVAPAAFPSGANGAWVRRFSEAANAKWFGATGDGTTDDYTALQAWLDWGGALFIPAAKYYCSAKLIVRKFVDITGAGYGFDNRVAGYSAMPGSRISFPAGVAGIDIQPQTTITDVAAALTAISGGTAFTQEGGYNSHIRNLALFGPNTGGAATGVYARTLCHLDNVHVYQFKGKGFDLSATSDTPDGNSEYGNLSSTSLRNCVASSCGSHGLHIRGRDANTVKIDNFNSNNNGGWGILNESLLGNLFTKPHIAGNVLGALKAIGGVAINVWDQPYIEGNYNTGCQLNGNNIVLGTDLTTVNTSPDADVVTISSQLQQVHALRINWNHFSSYSLRANDYGIIGGDSSYGLGFKTKSNYGFLNSTGNEMLVMYGADKSAHFQGNVYLDNPGSIYISGSPVVGARGAAIAGVPSVGATPTQAEVNAIVTAVNAIISRLAAGTGHGLIG